MKRKRKLERRIGHVMGREVIDEGWDIRITITDIHNQDYENM